MRTLTAQTITEKNSLSYKPILILKIIFGGSAGTKYFSSHPISSPVTSSGSIVNWGKIFSVLDERDVSDGNNINIEIADPEQTIKGYFSTPGIIGSEAIIYQAFDELTESDMVPLVKGRILESPAWSEGKKSVDIEVSDLSFMFKDIFCGTVCTPDIFEDIGEKDEGKILPIVYGKAERVKAVLVTRGAKTKLASDISQYSDTLYVDDASKFPSGPIRLRIGNEEITGSFTGNTFNITARGCSYQSGTVSETSGSLFIVKDSSLPSVTDNEYSGLFIKAEYGGYEQVRSIYYSIASTGALIISSPFFNEDGIAEPVESGTSFSITTVATKHPAGEDIVEVLDEYVYIAADHEATSIDSIEAMGVISPEIEVDGRVFAREREGFATLPVQYYQVDTNDDTTFTGLGHAVTTIKMRRLPTVIAAGHYTDDQLYVNMKGKKNTSENLIENPAEVIEDFLKSFCGIPSGNIDSASVSAAETALSSKDFSFAIYKRTNSLETAAELAFQAKLSLLWEDSILKFKILSNAMGTSTSTLDNDKTEYDSIEITSIDRNKVVSEIKAGYTKAGIKSYLTITDETVSDSLRGKSRTIEFWAYNKRHFVREAAEFWLRRLKHRYYEVTLTAFLSALEIQKGDTITLDRNDVFPAGQKGKVLSVHHETADYETGNTDRIKLNVLLPAWEGCSNSCEHACESGTCETSSCEMSCTSGFEISCNWTCESGCEEICQISCMAQCELSCQGTCMLSARLPGSIYDCQSTCETGCESSCEGWACETTNETSCAQQCETTDDEEVIPIREVRVLSSISTQYGSTTVIQVDSDGDSQGSSFTAYDPFDVHPAANELATVYLNFDYQWIFVPSDRLVKYVSIIDSTEVTNKYSVQEQSKDGTGWGSSFYAWAVDSV